MTATAVSLDPTLVAAVAAAAAAALLLPGCGVVGAGTAGADRVWAGAGAVAGAGERVRRGRRRASGRAVVLGAVVALAVALVPGRASVLAAVVGAAVVGGAALARRRGRRTARRLVAGRVQECCDLLAADLAAGLPPVAALDRAARAWPALAPVARAGRLGGDVPDALRLLAAEAGAEDLARLAAAWQVSQRTGQALADPVERTSAALRRARTTRRVVDSELSSARATARLLAGLPLLALLMGSGAGGDPWRFLLTTTAGTGCLAAGLGLALLGLAWIERIAEAVEAQA